MEKTSFTPPHPTVEELEQAIGYEKQHINVIAGRLHKRWPDEWPHPPLTHDLFYEKLLDTLVDGERYPELIATLESIAKRKGGRWTRIQIGPRVLQRATERFRELDPDACSLATSELREMDGPQALEWMTKHITDPDCAPHRKVFGWIIDFESGGENGKSADAGKNIAREKAPEPEALSDGDGRIFDFESRWDRRIDNLLSILSHSEPKRFSRGLLQELASSVDQLERLTDEYEDARAKETSILTNRLSSTLDDLEALISASESELSELIGTVRRHAKEGSFQYSLRNRTEVLDAIDTCAGSLRTGNDRCEELSRLLGEAKSSDDDAIIECATQRKAEKAGLAEAHEKLATILSELIGPVSSPGETDDGNEVDAAPEIPKVVSGPDGDDDRQVCVTAEPAIDNTSLASIQPPPQEHADDAPVEPSGSTPGSSAPGAVLALNTQRTQESSGAAEEPSTTDSVDFSVDVKAEDLVTEMGRYATPPAPIANALVWTLVRDDRLDLAYHLAKALQERGELDLAAHDADCLLAAFLARRVLGFSDEVAEPLSDALSNLMVIDFSSRQVRHRRANTLLAYAAALRPALLAPNLTGARAVLDERHLQLDSSGLHDLRVAVLDGGRLGSTLTAASLKGRTGPGGWERSLGELRTRCRTWWNEYRIRRIRYAPTTHVWQRWLEDDGPIGALLSAVADDRRELIVQARDQIDTWRDSSAVNRLLDQTDMEIRGGQAGRRPIDGSPRNDVVRLAAEAMRFVQEWLDLHAAPPTSERDTGLPELGEWTRRTGSLVDKAIADLDASLGDYQNLPDRAAAHAALAALKDLRDLLDPETPIADGMPWWKQVSLPLLFDSELHLDERWRLVRPYRDGETLARLIGLASSGQDWEKAFNAAERDCRHGSTVRLLEMLRWRQYPQEKLDVLNRRRDTSLATCRRQLNKRVVEIEGAVAHAVDYGYLDEDERFRIVGELEDCKARRSGNIGIAMQVLAGIEEDLRNHKQHRIEEERERLRQNQVLRDKPEQRERIERLLERGEIATAAEYVTHAENGREPPSDEQSDVFAQAFFPAFIASVTRNLGDTRGGDLLRALEDGRAPEPLSASCIARNAGAELLKAWLALKGKRGEAPALVRDLFSALGFVVLGIETDNGGHTADTLLELRTEPLQERSVCIVPQYGSLAGGRYRVSCIWERMPAEELRKHLGRRDGAATFLLYLNPLSENQRRELAYQCRQNRQSFLVLDEWLLYFLLDQDKGSRTSMLFPCAFPFAVNNPYTPTSSDVPDELFFGRRRAMEQIADRHGSNLVFGGRQLGKTALLREVKRRYHSPERQFYISWIDLKAAGIGLGRPPNEVWAVISHELSGYGLFSRQISRPETVRREVSEWLDANSDRRLLILLDESDELFVQDAENNYETLMGLKNLMELTDRRFKVVFAGLHNVQRMSRDVINSPVKHLSQPLCVGPLLENGDAKEAFRLVSLPLRILGYRLDDDVVNTILSYTNYYPNLIQHFCHSLLELLNDPDQMRFDAETTPPYVITPEQVEQAYRSRQLRQFIRDRFQITLDLDPRYRVIALRIALEILERRRNDEEITGGLSVEWIRGQALDLWPVGFGDRSTEAFRTLLDEMIGLGILRHAKFGYALRSPTIVNLLGTHDAIQQDLIDACDNKPPPIYRAATYRRPLGSGGDQWQRSPLVAEQEFRILRPETGTTLVFGAELSGVLRVAEAIATAATDVPEVDVLRICDVPDPNDFGKRLRAALDKQRQDSHLVIVVDRSCAWNETWVNGAVKALSHKRSKKTTARVTFVGDAAMAWIWSALSNAQRDDLGLLGEISLKPWSEETLHQWQRDTGIGPVTDSDIRKIVDATGLWDLPMFRLGADIRENPAGWRHVIDEARMLQSHARESLKQDFSAAGDAGGPMRVFAEVGEAMTSEDLEALAELPNLAYADRLVRWAELLSFVRPESDRQWRLDPFLARLLTGPET